MAIIEAVLRDTSDEDMPSVEEFYLSAPEKKREYLVLHLEDHKRAAENGFHFIVEVGGRIAGSTMVNPPRDGSLYAEAGNTLILQPVSGCNLQALFLELRAAALAVTEPDFFMTTGVNPDNESSYSNILAVEELTPWSPPASFYDLCVTASCKWRASLKPGRTCCCDFFLLSRENQRKLVRRYLERIQGRPFIELTKYDGDVVRLELRSRWASEELHLQSLASFAEGRDLRVLD